MQSSRKHIELWPILFPHHFLLPPIQLTRISLLFITFFLCFSWLNLVFWLVSILPSVVWCWSLFLPSHSQFLLVFWCHLPTARSAWHGYLQQTFTCKHTKFNCFSCLLCCLWNSNAVWLLSLMPRWIWQYKWEGMVSNLRGFVQNTICICKTLKWKRFLL